MLAVMLCLQSRCITNVAHSVRSKAGHAAIESRLETDQADRDHSVAIEPAFVVGLDARVRPDLFLIQCQPGKQQLQPANQVRLGPTRHETVVADRNCNEIHLEGCPRAPRADQVSGKVPAGFR